MQFLVRKRTFIPTCPTQMYHYCLNEDFALLKPHTSELFQKISKEFQFSHCAVQKIVFKGETFRTAATIPRCGYPTKFMSKKINGTT